MGPDPLAPICCGQPTEGRRVKAVNGGNQLGFECESCGATFTIFSPYRPDAAVTEVANPTGTNGNGGKTPAGAKRARQNGAKSKRRGWTNGIAYGRARKAKALAGMEARRGDGG